MFHFYLGEAIPSLTDWIQTIIMLFTGIGLVYTLLLQYKANKNQEELLKISVLPILKVKVSENDEFSFFDNDDSIEYGIISINSIANNAYNLHIEIPLNTIELRNYEDGLFSITQGQNFDIKFSYKIEDDANLSDLIPFFKIKLKFQDVLGNQYSQNFFKHSGNNIPSTPIQIKVKK